MRTYSVYSAWIQGVGTEGLGLHGKQNRQPGQDRNFNNILTHTHPPSPSLSLSVYFPLSPFISTVSLTKPPIF